MKALQRAESKPAKKGDAPPAPAAGPAPDKAASPYTHISRTIMPPKYEVVCPECRFAFQQTGRSPKTPCPKCRVIIEIKDHVLEGDFAGEIKTAGQVRITAGAKVTGGAIYAADIILEGQIIGGRVEAFRRLDIQPGGIFDEDAVVARDLRIAAGANMSLCRAARYRDVEVVGTLDAHLQCTGRVFIHAGGLFMGELQGPHLVVEDGGGLQAACRIAPAEPPAPAPGAPAPAP